MYSVTEITLASKIL